MTTPDTLPPETAAPSVTTRSVVLPLPDSYGALVVDEEFDYATGTAYYTIAKYPRASGTFTIRPYSWGLTPVPTDAGVWYGRGAPNANQCDRTDLPVVNGVTLAGGTHFDQPEEWRTFAPRRSVNVRTPTSRVSSTSAPEKTELRAGWIVIALLGRYVEHPERGALLRAAAEHDAAGRLDAVRRESVRVRVQIAGKRHEIADLDGQLGALAEGERALELLAERHAAASAEPAQRA